jgi:hypothetical protein
MKGVVEFAAAESARAALAQLVEKLDSCVESQ